MAVRVSVVIPTYESEDFIEDTLESVIRQTLPSNHLEVIVVDDASHDDSVRVASRFLEKLPLKSAVIRHDENRGPAAARNSGSNVARGDFIQFLDADDLLAPHKLALQVECAARMADSVAVVYSSWQNYSLEGGNWQASGPVHSPFVDDDPVLGILAQPTFWFLGPTLIRRRELERVGYFVEKRSLGEDVDLLLRLAMAGGRFHQERSATALLFYRQRPGSSSRSYAENSEALQNLLDTLRGTEEFLRKKSSSGELGDQAQTILRERYAKLTAFFTQREARIADGTSWLKRVGLSRPLAAWR